jgi:uncharacterized glyoxalase superfamily protein PhnB
LLKKQLKLFLINREDYMAKKVKPVPPGFHTVTPYLIVNGVPQLLNYLKKAFKAEEIYKMKMPDGSIGHAQVKIGDSFVMMGQASSQWKPMPGSIYLYVDDADNFYKLAIKAGGKSLREPTTEFYGDRTGGVEDPTGNQWWISTHVEDVSPKEMKKREKEWIEKRAV